MQYSQFGLYECVDLSCFDVKQTRMKTTVEPSSGIVKVPQDYGSFDEWEKVDEDGVGTGRRFIIVSQDDYRQNEKDLQQVWKGT